MTRSTSSTRPRWPRPVPEPGSITAERNGDTAVIPEHVPGERPPAWPHRHLLDTDVLTWQQIELVLDTAVVSGAATIVGRTIETTAGARGESCDAHPGDATQDHRNLRD